VQEVDVIKFIQRLSLVAVVVVATSISLAAVKKPVAAASSTPQVFSTESGRLSVSPEQLSSNAIQLYVTQAGMLISPVPTNPAMRPQWEATQVWIANNLSRLTRTIQTWQSEFRARPIGTMTGYLNQRLQEHLSEIGAIAEIESINRSIPHQLCSADPGRVGDGTSIESAVANGSTCDPNLQPTTNTELQICGPNGTPMKSVQCCTRACDPPYNCPWTCNVCDCDPSGESCCGYNL